MTQPIITNRKQYASFWRRANASHIDSIPAYLAIFIFVPGHAFHEPLMNLSFATFILFIAIQGKTGQTPGKMLCRISVVCERTHKPIGLKRGTIRHFGHFVDAIPLGLGFAWAIWDRKRQTWADKMVGSVVIRTDLVPKAEVIDIAAVRAERQGNVAA